MNSRVRELENWFEIMLYPIYSLIPSPAGDPIKKRDKDAENI